MSTSKSSKHYAHLPTNSITAIAMEAIMQDSSRIFGEQIPKRRNKKLTKKSMHINDRVWVLSMTTKIWREVVIIKKKSSQVKVHWISFHKKYDEWVGINSDRLSLKRPNGTKLSIGDNVSLFSPQFSAWLEAEVTDVNESCNEVEVLLVSPNDTQFEKEWLDTESKRMSIQHRKFDEPAPYID
eukprot:2736_1